MILPCRSPLLNELGLAMRAGQESTSCGECSVAVACISVARLLDGDPAHDPRAGGHDQLGGRVDAHVGRLGVPADLIDRTQLKRLASHEDLAGQLLLGVVLAPHQVAPGDLDAVAEGHICTEAHLRVSR